MSSDSHILQMRKARLESTQYSYRTDVKRIIFHIKNFVRE